MADLGTDFGGVFTLDANLSVVSGRTCLIQNLARRFNTQTGALPDEPTYGFALSDLIGDVFNATRVQQLAEDQLLDDERVLDAEVTATYDARTKTAVLVCKVADDDGPFEFTLVATELTVDLLGVTATG